MAFVITAACIDIKDGICTDVCPVDCIYEGGRMFYIHPIECIHCALCETICPVDAIRDESDLTAEERPFMAANAEFFEDQVTGWGSPNGWSPEFITDKDHPLIAKAENATEDAV